MTDVSNQDIAIWRALKLSHERLCALYDKTKDADLGEFIDTELWPLIYGDERKIEYIPEPILAVYKQDDGMACRIHALADADHRQFGIIVADVIRNVANYYSTTPEHVFGLVERELCNPTNHITFCDG